MAKRDWKPRNTKVFILGLGLEDWDDPNDPIGHRDAVLHKFFRKSGVPGEQNIHIGNEGGDRDSILEFLPDFLADSDEDTFFIFYYAGHGEGVEESEYDYDLYFCHPDEDLDSFTLADLVETIEGNFNGYNVLMIADCCQSGNIARFAETAETEFYYAGLTSALATESSTGAWTFTDCLLEALYGKSHLDRDDDGTISLAELAKYAKEQMREIENQKSDFGHGENFDPDVRLAVIRE
ncbi:MAG: hypothetical protein EAZ95_09155 [Bacteroidetes bacterium]|nr:MAG: hypothetical protein EAZ95_09155 [Bacteroidota bacterium]